MTCEDCVAFSTLKSEFADVKTDLKLIIRLISMLLAENGAKTGLLLPQPVSNSNPASTSNKLSSESSVSSEASAFAAVSSQPQQEPAAQELVRNFVAPAVSPDAQSETEGVDAASLLNVKCEELGDCETSAEACENAIAFAFPRKYNDDDDSAAYEPANIPTTSTSLTDLAAPSCSNYDDERPHKRLKGTTADVWMMSVGDDPNVLLSVAEYALIVKRSRSADKLLLHLLMATIPDYYNYTFETKRTLNDPRGPKVKEVRPSLREHRAFTACVNQTIKVFGVFEFDDKLKKSLYDKCRDARFRVRRLSVGECPKYRKRKAVKAANANIRVDNVGDSCNTPTTYHS